MSRLAVLLLAIGLSAGSVGCDKPPPASCSEDSQCGPGLICHSAALDGICGAPCSGRSTELPPDAEEGALSPADEYCRTQMGSDADDDAGIAWACAPATGQCFRANACQLDEDCGEQLLCHEQVAGAADGLARCLPACTGTVEGECPPGNACNPETGKCGPGCESEPDNDGCPEGQLCQRALGMPSRCTEPCAPGGMGGFDCSDGGQLAYACDTATGLCKAGCEGDAACPSGRVCHLVEAPGGAGANACFPPCPMTDCSVFDTSTVKYTCVDSHCVVM